MLLVSNIETPCNIVWPVSVNGNLQNKETVLEISGDYLVMFYHNNVTIIILIDNRGAHGGDNVADDTYYDLAPSPATSPTRSTHKKEPSVSRLRINVG